MFFNINNIFSSRYKDCKIIKINTGSSRRKYYRLIYKNKKLILMDSSKEEIQFDSFINVYKILSNLDISIPRIYEIDNFNKILIIEDLGDYRFDKILNKDNQKKLLLVAVKSLIKIKKEINIDKKYNLPTYNYKIFHSEISEFVDYFFPFYKKKKMSNDLKEEFFSIWKSNFNSFDFNFTSFVHKDYNINNLIYLPNRRNHCKCGILDFQDSFWGEDCWDLFSLLEDSRIFFDAK